MAMKLAIVIWKRPLKLLVLDLPVPVEGDVGPREREHVGVDARAEMLEGDAQGPDAAVAADHRRRSRQQQGVSLVEGLWVEARDPVDGVLEHARH